MKEEIIKLRLENKSYTQIVEIIGCSKSTVHYYCKDLNFIFKKDRKVLDSTSIEKVKLLYNSGKSIKFLANEYNVSEYEIRKYTKGFKIFKVNETCVICNKQINQLQNRNRTKCNACNTKLRRHRNKIKAVDLLGGKCNRCGYDGNIVALEFHHTDPSEKSFNIGEVGNKSWESIVKEIEKCELLCSNCHRIEHSNREGIEFLKYI